MFRAHYPENKIRTYKKVKNSALQSLVVFFHFNEEKQNKIKTYHDIKDNFQFHFSSRGYSWILRRKIF